MQFPHNYDLYKSGGITIRDDSRGVKTIMYFFPGHFTEEKLCENMKRYNSENMLALIKDYFLREYGYAGDNIELNNRYQKTINSYIYNDQKNPAVVHIDELFESTMMAFLLSMLKWSKDFDNLEIYGNCYKYVLYLMNDVCIMGEMQGDNANREIFQKIYMY